MQWLNPTKVSDIIKTLFYIKKCYFQFEVILTIRIKISGLLDKN